MANAPKVYDFPVSKVQDQLVGFLRKRRGESTVADMIAGTGLPKYQVEQTAKMVLDEYAGRLKVTESGELLYYFPGGMHSTVHGLGPSLRRFWKTFTRGAARVLSFLFKVWIVAMLVGYFVAFLAIAVVAVVASVAASAAGRGGRDDRGGRDGGGFGGLGGMYLVINLLDLVLRMWFWTSILKDPRRARPREGRAFYKSVFGFVFGEDDPNRGFEEEERKRIIAYIRGTRGVVTLEELMALTGRETEEANALMNRLLLEYEGEPGVTDNGTLIYSFPALMRTSRSEAKSIGSVQLSDGASKRLVPFSANKKKTNGWIIFFNAFNLAFGAYFLGISLTQGSAIFQALQQAALTAAQQGKHTFTVVGPALYSTALNLVSNISSDPVSVLLIGLGIIPVAFSIVFFLIPLFRRIRLERQNDKIREEILRKRIMGRILASPSRVDANDVHPTGSNVDPKNFVAACKRLVERIAAQMKAEPLVQEGGKGFAYRFPDLERELADLAAYRQGVDVGRYDVGKTVFDSGD